MMSIRPKRTHFCSKMLRFEQLTQLNLVIAVGNTPTRANSFNLSDPAVLVNERAVTSRHRNEEYTKNPPLVAASIVGAFFVIVQCTTSPINSFAALAIRL